MYDLPPARSSPPYTTSAMLPTNKMTRSNSPIPHISTLIPHHHHTHHQYSPNSRAADISRLLDPSYASYNSSSSGSSQRSAVQASQTRAYVDHHGDLHDPDYRDFPVLPSTRQKSNPPRRRSAPASAQLLSRHNSTSRLSSSSSRQPLQPVASSSTTQAQQTDRYSTYPLVARPEWERDWATEIENLEEDDEEVLDLNSPFVRASSIHTTPSSRRASLTPSIYAHSSFFYNEPAASVTSSPVDSLEEHHDEDQQESGLGLSESPFEDLGGAEELMEVEDNASASKCRTGSILRRMKRNGSQSSVQSPVAAVDLQEKQQLSA